MHWIACQAFLALLVPAAHAADAWKTYTHESPAFSIDHPATWDVTVAETFADANIGGRTLEGEADVTFEVSIRDEPLRIMVFAYAIPADSDMSELLDALKVEAEGKGRLTRYEGVGGHDALPSVRYETKDVGRAEILTYLFDIERLLLVHMNVPDTWLEACREGYDHAVRSLETDLLARRPRIELPSAEAFAADLVRVIEATETLRNAEMIRLFDEGTDLLRKGLAQGRRIFFKLAQHRFRAMLDVDRNVALGHFALGLAHFYAWEMGAAQEEFREAVRLDQQLEPLVPLLSWDDFRGPIEYGTRGSAINEGSPWSWEIVPGPTSVLRFRNPDRHGIVFTLAKPGEQPYGVMNTRTLVRFNLVRGTPGISVLARCPRRNIGGTVRAGYATMGFYDPETKTSPILETLKGDLEPGWHVASWVVCGRRALLYVDGRQEMDVRLPEGLEEKGHSTLSLWGPGEILVDWVLVTRYAE